MASKANKKTAARRQTAAERRLSDQMNRQQERIITNGSLEW